MLFLRVHYPLWCWPSDCSIKINISVSVPRIRYYLLFIENRRSNKIFPARAFLNTLQENPLVMKAQFLSLFAFKTSLPAIVPSNLHSPVAQLVANLTWKKKIVLQNIFFQIEKLMYLHATNFHCWLIFYNEHYKSFLKLFYTG